MKLKKIIALSISAMMMLSTIASAELTVDTSDDSITTLPTVTEIKARNPKVAFEVGNKYTDQDTLRTDTARSFSNSYSVDAYDIYPVTVTLSDVGDLASGYEYNINGIGYAALYNIKLQLKTDKVIAGYTKATLGSGTYTAAYDSAEPDYYALACNISDYYPSANADESMNFIANAPITSKFVLVIEKSTAVEIAEYKGSITYKLGAASSNGAEGYPECSNVTFSNTLKMGETAKEFKFTEGTHVPVTAGEVNGLVIAGNKMENVDTTKTYVATFTADNTDPKTSTLKNLPEATTFTFDAVLRFKDNTVKNNIKLDVAAAE